LAENKKNTLFQRWLLPGFLFQSVIIGGGYATGRELVEFFLSVGPPAGLFDETCPPGTDTSDLNLR